MIAPPRTIELLLASLGAQPDFRDAVIGDLAEEFAHRAERDGLGAARRWYYREAGRAIPHLTSNAFRRFGARGVLHRIGIAATAYTIVLMTALTTAAIVGSIAIRLGAPRTWHLPEASWVSLLAMFGILAVDAAMAVFGGYLAAYLDADAPLFSAATLGMSWVGATLAVGAIVRAVGTPPTTASLAPLWLRCAAIATVVGGSIAGGVLRIRTRQPAHDEDLLRAGA